MRISLKNIIKVLSNLNLTLDTNDNQKHGKAMRNDF